MMKPTYIGVLLCAGLGLAARLPQVDGAQSAQVQPSAGERIASLASQVRGSQWAQAIQAGEGLLQDGDQLGERQRSEVHFATALARAMRAAEEPLPGSGAPAQTPPAQPGQAPQAAPPTPVLGAGYIAASGDFESSRALAGPGQLRLAATYDLGTSALLRAELWRLEIPEIAQANGQQPTAPMTQPGAAPAQGASEEAQAPDPLAEARQAYLQAKQRLILRLRSDWNDADNRANLELIQRRLRELDEIEEQRKKEEQESEDEQQDSEDQQEGEEGEEGEDQEQKDEQEESEEGEEGDEQEDSEQEGEEESEEEEPSEEEGEEEQEGEEERQDSEADGGEAQSTEQEPAERVLTREEVIRLLDKLSELEAEAQELKDAQTKSKTVRVDRDW